MIKLKTIIYFAFLILIINACGEDFLDSKPLTLKTDVTYYTTPEEAEEALVGCYDGIQRLTGLSIIVGPEITSDNCFGSAGTTDGLGYPMIDEFYPPKAPSYTNAYNDAWEQHYSAIYRCNLLILKIDQIDWTDQEDLRYEIEAEARYLRAFLYFSMVRMFERIPLLTEPSNENIPQSEPDETYEVITNDLLFAIEYGSDDKYDEIASSDFGHANKWAAEALLGRVYLYYTGYYQESDLVGLVTGDEVLTYLEDVIENSGYGLVDSYYDIWPASSRYYAVKQGNSLDDNTYAGETSKEILFSIRYTYTGAYATVSGEDDDTDGPDWQDDIGIRNQAFGKYGYASGWGVASVVPEFYDAFADGDERQDASIIGISEEGLSYTKSSSMQEYTGYFIKKYTPLADASGSYLSNDLSGNTNFQINQYVDFIVMRYADVLLMAAEMGSSNALDYFNQVHTRAGLDAVSSIDKDAIFDERRFEFGFEGIRYWDLLRYDGKDDLSYAADAVTISTTVKTSGSTVEKVIDGSNLKTLKGLYQIPADQIDLSGGVIEQNPGWD